MCLPVFQCHWLVARAGVNFSQLTGSVTWDRKGGQRPGGPLLNPQQHGKTRKRKDRKNENNRE
jgi:hypothetical protein